ncbi:MAG TPA: DUF6510 family protein [Candidatus Sulfotelmatobacter sp.]|nr:DUF6510 family protein [Candidatus Sulfotelmatobacter sp.]
MEEMRLDGNAIAGLLREIFTMEMTTSEATCEGCGTVSVMGRVHVYMNAPGIVVRCPGCEQVLIRIVKGPQRYWVDMRGMRCLELSPGQA